MRHASIASRPPSPAAAPRCSIAPPTGRIIAPSSLLAADGDAFHRAAAALAAAAIAEIDLTAHAGVHPRIARRAAVRAARLGVDGRRGRHRPRRGPRHRRDAACAGVSTKPRRARLSGVRSKRCGAAGSPACRPCTSLRAAGLRSGRTAPDGRSDGDRRATAGGVELVPIARPAARPAHRASIRTSGGGLLPQALGLCLEHRPVQVSMNLTDYRTTSMGDVFVRSRPRRDTRAQRSRTAKSSAWRPRAVDSPGRRACSGSASP